MSTSRTIERTLSSGRRVKITGYTRLCRESYESLYDDDAELVVERAEDAETGEEIEDAETLTLIDGEAFDWMVEAALEAGSS